MRAALDELVRREVFTVSADPLSPEKGSYGFAQDMLRQVAYDTLSRRDRKTRHLAVAAHLRAAFPSEGEEVADVIARHYLDALEAVPQDPDTPQIRRQAITALTRAAERAQRTGASAHAATCYATAAQLTEARTSDIPDTQPAAGPLWERAAEAAMTGADWLAAVQHAGRARERYLELGQARSAASAQAIMGGALRRQGRIAEARDQLTAALGKLRTDPDTGTVRALEQLALLEVFARSPDADRLSTEALALGQALDADAAQLAGLFTIRGIYHGQLGRRPQMISYHREAARLATQAGDHVLMGRVLLNLSDALAITDPAAAVEAARTAAGHLRRAGALGYLPAAIMNLVYALLLLGDWDTASNELTYAADSDGLADIEILACYRGWLAALRNDTRAAEAIPAALAGLRVSKDPDDKALVSTVEAFTAAASHQPKDALRHACAALTHATAIGISNEFLRWAWPLAARSAYDLAEDTSVRELLSLLDSHMPGHLAPKLRAERDLAHVRLAARDGDQSTAASFVDAVNGLRQQSTPYHLAHGLLDHEQHLTRLGNAEAAETATSEARDIAGRLRCQPLLDRAADLALVRPPVQA